MSLKTYLNKNPVDISFVEKCFLRLFKKFQKIGISDENNLAGMFFHEIMAFYATNISAKNLKKDLKKEKITSLYEEKFSLIEHKKRNFSFKNKNNFIFEIYNNSIGLPFTKKLVLGLNLPLSLYEKISIFFFALFNGYQIIYLPKSNKVKINKFQIQLNEILKLNKKLSKKYKIQENSLNFIKLIKSYISDQNFPTRKKDIYILGSLGNFYNRLLAIEAKQRNSTTFITNEEYTFGFLSILVHRYDSYYLCDNFLTVGNLNPKILDQNYRSLSDKRPKILYKANYLKKYFSNNIEPLNFNNLKELKGLYIPTRITKRHIQKNTFIYHNHYLSWQFKLLKELPKIFVKPHSKFDLSKFPKNKKILDKNLKILDIYRDFDYIAVDQISSSTFGDIAITNKPILYFNIGLDSKQTKIGQRELLKRVYEVKVRIFNNYKGFDNIYNIKKKLIKNSFLHSFCSLNKKIPKENIYKLLKKTQI